MSDKHAGADTQPNALSNETSPYLLQHAHNPVQWRPWGEAALEAARAANKPILLSIGYSACHWCHVMAHESFEDPETARVMNDRFINIKVDREERPDLDKIYQIAHQLLTRRGGGWPLTLFLTPDDRVPFFGGTYFPPQPRYGMPAFRDILVHIAQAWQEDEDAIRHQNTSFMEAMHSLEPAAADSGTVLDATPLAQGVNELAQNFDHRLGGFTGAPKFPHPTTIEFLLQHYALHRDDEPQQAATCLDMAGLTLRRMAEGGIHDHLGGGFCRYSVDERWMIPHFEKMLYDNGPLLAAYALGFRLTGDDLFRQAAEDTAGWVLRDMQDGDGGFYSSLDADSEGEEGRFYLWTPEEVQKLLTAEEYRVFAPRYGLDRPANFEGGWHLYSAASLEEAAQQAGVPLDEAVALLRSARGKLLAIRGKRLWPGRDEKILTAWNALMIRGLAVGAACLEQPDWTESAARALEFVRTHLWRDGRLLATCKDGRAHLNAYLDDYAFLIDAILHLLNCRWETAWLDFALELADVMLGQFYDREGGGFFFTSHDHEALLQRRKDYMDDAIPAGNGIAASVLLQLGHLTGRQDCLNAAAHTLRAAWSSLQRLPHGHIALLSALQDTLVPPDQIVIRGPADAIEPWRQACPADARTEVYAIPDDAGELPALLAEKRSDGRPVAYICTGMSCRAPVHELPGLRDWFLKHRGGR